MIHARDDYNRIQDPAVENPSLAPNGTPISKDEPVFLLRASDMTASLVVLYWAKINEEIGGDVHAIELARKHAQSMASFPRKKVADI